MVGELPLMSRQALEQPPIGGIQPR